MSEGPVVGDLASQVLVRLEGSGVDIAWWHNRRSSHGAGELTELMDKLSLADRISDRVREGDDKAVRGDSQGALHSYQAAVDLSPSPAIQLAVGALLAARAGVEAPWREAQFDGYTIGPNPNARLLRWLDVDIEDPSGLPDQPPLLDLALDAFGRVLAHYVESATKWGEFDDPSRWRMYPCLDGIATAVEAKDRDSELLEPVCQIYFEWYSDVYWDLRDEGYNILSRDPFMERFSYREGFLEGRKERGIVEAASDIMNGPVPVGRNRSHPPDAPLRRLPTRTALAESLEEDFGDLWVSIPDYVKAPLIEGDQLLAIFRSYDRQDYGPAVVEYAKAVEWLCTVLAPTNNSFGTLGTFARDNESPLPNVLRSGAPVKQLMKSIGRMSRARNDAAHAPRSNQPSRYTSLPEAESIRSLALEIVRDITEWRKGS